MLDPHALLKMAALRFDNLGGYSLGCVVWHDVIIIIIIINFI